MTRHIICSTGQVIGKSNARSNSIYVRDIRIVRILRGAILGCCVREVITSRSSSVEVSLGVASREVGTLVLDDLLKNIVEDGLGVIRVFDLSTDAKDVATLSCVVLDVVICALVGELRHLDLLRGELFVKIEEIKTGWW